MQNFSCLDSHIQGLSWTTQHPLIHENPSNWWNEWMNNDEHHYFQDSIVRFSRLLVANAFNHPKCLFSSSLLDSSTWIRMYLQALCPPGQPSSLGTTQRLMNHNTLGSWNMAGVSTLGPLRFVDQNPKSKFYLLGECMITVITILVSNWLSVNAIADMAL